jgi:hypothetical protein
MFFIDFEYTIKDILDHSLLSKLISSKLNSLSYIERFSSISKRGSSSKVIAS